MSSGIYVIFNKFNRKVYVGQSANLQERLRQHQIALMNNKHPNKELQADYNKCPGDFEFTIILTCYLSQLNYYEKDFIRKYRSDDPRYGYNHTKGGGPRKRKNKKGQPTDLLDELTN